MSRYDWAAIVPAARVIVESCETPVTLRTLFYQLVAVGLLPNSEKDGQNAYKSLSDHTAKLRRRGEFPDLSDRGRTIHRAAAWPSPEAALDALAYQYRRDRTEGQPYTVCVAVEKAGMIEELMSWFGHLGAPVLALSGYASQSFVDQVRRDVDRQGRPAVLLYAGDFDPSGMDIPRDFAERAACFDAVERVALTPEQVAANPWPVALGKSTDARAKAFEREYGGLYQVELDAMPPQMRRGLYQEAVDRYWDMSAFADVLVEEENERRELEALCS